jgi:hypothetical protein
MKDLHAAAELVSAAHLLHHHYLAQPEPAAPTVVEQPAPDKCPTCGSDCNERDELEKADREIERLRAALEQPEPAAPTEPAPGWCKHCQQYTIAEPLPAAPTVVEPDVPEISCGNMEPDLFTTDIVPRPLKYTLSDYHKAMSEGPLHYTWQDKPHRLVYDLIAAVRYYATPPRAALTDAQLLDILQSLDACTARLPGGFRLFARAIEAAHGIGGPRNE